MSDFGKGSRVEIVSGEGEGQAGTIFWWGKSKYGDNMRAGVKGDDGETYWTDAEDLIAEGARTHTPEPSEAATVESKQDFRPSVPLPFVAAHPREGSHMISDAETVETGKYVDGLRHGAWKTFSADGQKLEETEWRRGRRHGAYQELSADGVLLTEGDYSDHRKSGEWRHYYETGEFKESYNYDDEGEKHGPYVWDLEDGSPRARGSFRHGKRHGDWEWQQGDDYERSLRSYHRGANHGEAARWYRDGQLEYRCNHYYGAKHGEERRFHPDGTPAFEGTWRYGYGVGTHRSWDESGAETVTRFIDGIASETDAETGEETVPFDVEKATEAVLSKDEASDKTWALDEFVEFGRRSASIFHMWKSGAYDAPKDPPIWEALSRAHGLFSGDDIVSFLADVTTDMPAGHLPNWSRWLDRLVMNVYARDPEPLDAARESFPEPIRRGVELVRARFGQDIGDILHDQLDALVTEHVDNYGIRARIDWPVEGRVEEVELFRFAEEGKETTDYFRTFIAWFGGFEAWSDALEERALAKLSEGSEISFDTFRPVVENADEDLMVRLCESIALNNSTEKRLRNAVLEWRDYDAESLTRLALAVDDEGLRKWPLLSQAVLKLAEEGDEIPDELVDAFILHVQQGGQSKWAVDERDSIPDEFEHDPHYVADALPMERATGFPRVHMIHQALSKLSQAQLRSIIERYLEKEYYETLAAPYVYLVDDPELWGRAIEFVKQNDMGWQRSKTWGFGEIGLRVLPLLEAALEDASSKKFRYAWRQAIVCALTRAALDGDEIPEEYDRHIGFDLVEKAYKYQEIRPYVERLLYLLPTERAEPIIAAGFDGEHWGRALHAASLHPTKSLLSRAFQTLLENDSTMEAADRRAVRHLLGGLPNPEEWVRWLLEMGGGAGCRSELVHAIGSKAFKAIEEELENPVKELDAIDELVNIAEQIGGGEEIYLLRRLDEPTGDDLNVIGGPAPGVDAERWPTFEDEPMAHLYTLDLETMPALDKRFGARTISVFCHNPGFNEAWDAGTPQTAVVFTTAEQLADAGAPPDGIDEKPEAGFEVVGVDVDLSDEKLRRKVYNASARVMGPPMWLQDEAHNGDYLMQFDSQFIHMNLGDMGIMYVFADTAFWQCH